MSNPYAPPKTAVGDVSAPAPLPLLARVLRVIAIIGSALIALIPILALLAPLGARRPDFAYLVFAAASFLFSGATIAALLTRAGARAWFWAALLVNASVVAGFGYVLFFAGVRNPEFALVFLVPAILNLAALGELRRTRRN